MKTDLRLSRNVRHESIESDGVLRPGVRRNRRRSSLAARMARTAALASLLALSLTAQVANPVRKITFNDRALTSEQLTRLEKVERYYGVRIPDGAYWYDNRSGAVGFWKGPGAGALPPGLGLGGPMPTECSGGDTGVFVNGRELHRLDVAVLSQLGPVYPGRYWVDANGNFGFEGGPALGNLFALARRVQSPGPHRVYAPGELSGIIVNRAGACTSSGNCAYPGR